MLYFSPLSVTDDKQRDRKHPFSSFYSAGRAKHGGRWGERPTVQARYLGELVDVVACENRSMRIQDRYVDVEGVGWLRAKVFAACSGGVVCLSLDIGKVWRIVPCVYKIYTLGRFQFHNLLRRIQAGRAVGGGREGIWQDAPEYKLIRCIPYDILSNVLET